MLEIDPKKFTEVVEKHMKEREKEKEIRKQFFENKQDEFVEKVYQYVTKKGPLDSEYLSYNTEAMKDNITIDDFDNLTNNIIEFFRFEKPEYILEEVDSSFPTEIFLFKYKDAILELFQMFGQGVFVSLKVYEPNDDEEIEFLNYEEIEFIEEITF